MEPAAPDRNRRNDMANKALFKPLVGKLVPAATTVNEAGGAAYALRAEQALAQYVVTGCMNGTFYATAEDQLANILALAKNVDSEFLAKVAVYAREKAAMKDAPALLLAVLSVRNPRLLAKVF